MQLLIVEYLPDHNLYMVVSVQDGKIDQSTEYVFSTEAEAAEFVRYYFKDRVLAVAAYYLMEYQKINRKEVSHG